MFKIFFFIFFVFSSLPSYAQEISITLDTAALNSILKKNWGSYYNLPGPFAARNINITSIGIFGLSGSFILDFNGKLQIPVPFFGIKEFPLATSILLRFSCPLKIKDMILYVPVKNITLKRGGVRIPMSSKVFTIISDFKKMITRGKTKTLLDKKLKIDFSKIIPKFAGKGKWKLKKNLLNNKIQLFFIKQKSTIVTLKTGNKT